MQLKQFNSAEMAGACLSGRMIQLSRRALDIHYRLDEIYRDLVPDYGRPRMRPLNQLVFSLLSQRSTGDRANMAFRTLCHGRKCWEEIRDASVSDTLFRIEAVTYAEQKAPYLHQMLWQVTRWCEGAPLSLDLLGTLSDEDALDLLMRLRGVGPKTSSATLLFSTLRRSVLPIDTHFLRIAKRMELIPEWMDLLPAHSVLRAQLPGNWGAPELERHYYLMKRHGQACCTALEPKCDGCPLLDLCRYGKGATH